MDSRYSACPTCGSRKKASARECQGCVVIRRYGTPAERFWRRVNRGAGCWTWQGHIATNGYGRIYWRGKQRQAHRVAYELERGPVPDDLTLDHLCRNPRCVNPSHLDPVTDRVNILRGTAPSAVNARKERCPEGHRYDATETIRGKPVRYCLRCRRERESRYRRGRTAARLGPRPCPVCARQFSPKRRDGVYCSTACRNRANYAKATA